VFFFARYAGAGGGIPKRPARVSIILGFKPLSHGTGLLQFPYRQMKAAMFTMAYPCRSKWLSMRSHGTSGKTVYEPTSRVLRDKLGLGNGKEPLTNSEAMRGFQTPASELNRGYYFAPPSCVTASRRSSRGPRPFKRFISRWCIVLTNQPQAVPFLCILISTKLSLWTPLAHRQGSALPIP